MQTFDKGWTGVFYNKNDNNWAKLVAWCACMAGGGVKKNSYCSIFQLLKMLTLYVIIIIQQSHLIYSILLFVIFLPPSDDCQRGFLVFVHQQTSFCLILPLSFFSEALRRYLHVHKFCSTFADGHEMKVRPPRGEQKFGGRAVGTQPCSAISNPIPCSSHQFSFIECFCVSPNKILFSSKVIVHHFGDFVYVRTACFPTSAKTFSNMPSIETLPTTVTECFLRCII